MGDATLSVCRIRAEDTIDLRHRVMWPDLPRESVILTEDPDALHFGAYLDGVLVGVGSFFPDGKAVRLRKLAVDPEVQGHGIARALLEHAFGILVQQGYTNVWCDARVSALSFYRRLAFELDETVFVKQGLDYVKATRRLPA